MIDECDANGLALCLSNEDQISAFLKTIPKDCKNSELLIAKGIIEGDRSRFPTLVGNVIPHLTLSIEAKEPGTSVAKRTIANTLDRGPTSGIGPVALPGRPPGSSVLLTGKWWGPLRVYITPKSYGRL